MEHPTGDGEQVGHMEDINTANLKLSQVQICPNEETKLLDNV